MNTKQIILLVLWVAGLVSLAYMYTRYRAVSKPISQSVMRIYDTRTCLQMQSIHRKDWLCRLLKRVAELVVFSLILIFDVQALVARQFGNGFFEDTAPVLAFTILALIIVGRPFEYIIKNVSATEAFLIGPVASFILTFIIGLIVSFVIKLDDLEFVILGLLMLIPIMLMFGYIAIFISWIDYRLWKREVEFIPECDATDLQSKLCNLFARYGYKVNKTTIKSIDTSQNADVLLRKTLHKHIKIIGDTFSQATEVVISEQLMDTMTEDEICAICSYGLYSKILRTDNREKNSVLFSRAEVGVGTVTEVVLFLLYLLLENMERVCTDFNFKLVNYGFLAALALVIYKVISSGIANAVVWRTERSADIRVCNDGYADAWISALEKLEGDKKFEVHSSDPSLLERINAIDKYKSKLNKRKK